ncbi:MAG: hypothetical protein FWH22_08045 [Fibromonadales bacterium]|nr:hypothetical protein [Fibromonadales bacterium]
MAKKKDSFEKKFKDVILSYPDKKRFKFVKAMKEIAKIVKHSISNGEYGNFCPKTEKKLLEALETCQDYKNNCDAVYNIEKYVLDAKNGSIITKKCPKYGDFRKEMEKHLADLPNRGFVYIAWRQIPSQVHYIGMTRSSSGNRILDLSKNVHLSRAIEKRATQFTIIFPDNSDNIRNVEGSFIRIMKIFGYDILNLKPEYFYPWEGGFSDLSKLEKFFIEMRNKVSKVRRRR